MDDDLVSESERLQIQQIRELEWEELQVEEVDSASDDDFRRSEEDDRRQLITNEDITLAADALDERNCSHECGASLQMPMLCSEGAVLFPEVTLPLIVVQPHFKAAVNKAIYNVDSVNAIAVVRSYKVTNDVHVSFSMIGTCGEIREYKQTGDGSLHVLIYGKQRFHLKNLWVDVDAVPWVEVQMIQEDKPLRIPKDAFGQLASVHSIQNFGHRHAIISAASFVERHKYEEENYWERFFKENTASDYSMVDIKMFGLSSESHEENQSTDESMFSEDELTHGSGSKSTDSHPIHSESECHYPVDDSMSESGDESDLENAEFIQGRETVTKKMRAAGKELHCLSKAARSFWPHWVYRMYDSYYLAWRTADLSWKIMRDTYSYNLVNKPDILSYVIANRIPIAESVKQELLEIECVSKRLRREIELLQCYNFIRCKTCMSVVAMRSDRMFSEGLLAACAKLQGYEECMFLLFKADGLSPNGLPHAENSWFPGYTYTNVICSYCETRAGWIFSATTKQKRPKYIWGLWHTKIASSTWTC